MNKHCREDKKWFSRVMVSLLCTFFLWAPAQCEKRMSGNPIVKHIRTADPSVYMGHDGLLYMLTSRDMDDAVDYSTMDGYRIFSTSNLVDWKDHGEILHSRDLEWGKEGYMYAPDMTYLNGTYYMYFPHRNKEDKWRVGLATSQSPTGPFKSQGIVTGPNMKGGFDPRCFVDDDGSVYLYWGARYDENKAPMVAKLKDNMVELAEEPRVVDCKDAMKQFTKHSGEGIYMHKHKGKYYFSFSGRGGGWAAIGDNPYGPFENLHRIGKGWGAQDHHSIIEVKGQWYYFHHLGNYKNKGTFRGQKDNPSNRFRRNSCVNYLYYNDDGTIKMVKNSPEGVAEIALP
jgi:beta-xylosidase